MSRARLTFAIAILLAALPAPASAQAFLASKSKPGFEVGPLTVRAQVTPKLGPVDISVIWSLVPPPTGSAAGLEQDLYLMWPGPLQPDAKAGSGDPALEKYVTERGFEVTTSGRLAYSALNLYRTGTDRAEAIEGGAPFVTFVRKDAGPLGSTTPASFIRLPWDHRALNRAYLMRLNLRVDGLIRPKPSTWIERTLWGKRYRLSLSFNEVRQRGLFRLYLEHRDRVVHVSEDPAQLIVDFTDNDRLKIDELFPPSATRAPSESRAKTERVARFLDRSEGLVPQVLTVQFGYFSGLQSWAPVLIPLAIFAAGNVGGVLLRNMAERLAKRWAGRVGFWRRREEETTRETGVVADREKLARLTPGTTTHEQVLDLIGRTVDERVSLNAPDRRTLVYRGRRVIPRRRRVAGLLATVTHWDVEDHEIEIVLDHDVVQDVQANVRRHTQATPPA
ncbi:MAG TPA: hypothetical protein VGT02_11720 [Methylomirabilota bacterium]|nr:hypothetical protein [Methylomirabilota bacterium]